MKREEILARAKDIVSGDRDQQYGSPENSFNRIAQLWQAYLKIPIEPIDVANMMILFKVARLQAKPNHEDSWVDIAGYAACGGEIATKKEEPPHVKDFKDLTPADWEKLREKFSIVREGEW